MEAQDDAGGGAAGTVYLDVIPSDKEGVVESIGADVPRGDYVVDNHKYTAREKVRLLVLKPGVQATIVICALIDIFMLLAQVRSGCARMCVYSAVDYITLSTSSLPLTCKDRLDYCYTRPTTPNPVHGKLIPSSIFCPSDQIRLVPTKTYQRRASWW